MKIDFLESQLFDPRHSTSFIGYTSYTRKRITTSGTGIWVGYRTDTRHPFFEMRFRHAFPKEKFSQDIWTHVYAIVALLDKVHWFLDGPPKILISSRKAQRFFNESQYKWKSISGKEKSKIHFYMDTIQPNIETYSALVQPYAMLREMMLEDSQHVSELVAGKKFFDYSVLNE